MESLPENNEWSAIRRAASAVLSIELAFTLQAGRLSRTFFSTSSRKSLETPTRTCTKEDSMVSLLSHEDPKNDAFLNNLTTINK
jgi:hypothetical protein